MQQNQDAAKVVLIGVLVGGTILIGSAVIEYHGQQTSSGANQQVTRKDAIRYIENFKKSPSIPRIKGAYFGKNVLDKLLEQSGVTGIRFYYGKRDDGVDTMVLVGVDSLGNDLVSGVLAEDPLPCPPICSAPNELNK